MDKAAQLIAWLLQLKCHVMTMYVYRFKLSLVIMVICVYLSKEAYAHSC